ncbi:MAG: hypothetical protein J7515_12485, partial [Caulobacter sp.]|nr:hypothetical protein [Caulobacter sp.]
MPTTAEILKLLRRASIGIGYKDRQSGPYTTPAAYQALLSGFYGSPARFPANMGVGVNAALSFAAGQGVSTTMPVLYQGAKGATVIITKTTVNGQSTYQLMVDGIDTGNGEGFRDIKDVAGQNGGIPSQQIADINAAIVQLRQVEGLGAAPIVFDYALGHSHGAATIVDYARANPTMFRNLELYDPQGTVRRFAGTDPLVSYNIGVQAIATTSDFLSMGFSESGTEGLSPLMMWEAGVGLWNNVWLSLPANAGRTILNDYTPLSQYGGMNYSHTWDSLGALIHDAGYDTAPSGWNTPLWNEKAMAYARADVGGLSHNVDGSVRFTERWETSTKLFQNIAAAAISAVGPRKLQAGVGLYDINPTYVNGNSIFNLNVTYTSTDGAVVVTVATTLSVNGIYADTASALNTGTASVVGRNVTLTSGGRTLTSNITGSSAGGQQTVVLSDANGSVTMPFSFDAEGGATPKGSMVMTGTSGRTLAAQFVRGLAPTLADALVPNDKLGNAVTNVVLTVALNNLAAAINNGGRVDASKAASTATDAAASSISAQLGAALRQNIIGSASSYLTAELGEALGLHGFGAELFGTVGNSVFSSVLSNVYTTSSTSIFGGFHVDQLFKSSNWSQALDSTTLGKGISAFVGAKLGASIVAPQTKAGLVLSQLGSSFGSMLISAGLSSTVGAGVTGLGVVGTAANAIGATLSQAFGAYANFIAPGVGALIGFVLGALIGNLFGRKKPRVPTANAETVLQIPYAHYELGAVTTANGGSRDLVTNMALGARDTLNELISLITAGGENGPTYVSNLYSPTQKYGHTGGQVWVEIGGQHKNVASADEAVEKGVLYAIKSTKIVGGDLFIKRLINNNSPESILELMGGIQAARDYAKYARELTAINAIISADPGGAFAASWLVTFNQISELKINQFSTSDFYGGLQGFLSSFDLKGHGVAFENVRISAQGNSAEIQARGQTSDGVFSILPQAMDGASDNDVLNAR